MHAFNGTESARLTSFKYEEPGVALSLAKLDRSRQRRRKWGEIELSYAQVARVAAVVHPTPHKSPIIITDRRRKYVHIQSETSIVLTKNNEPQGWSRTTESYLHDDGKRLTRSHYLPDIRWIW
jgi:hypothetical protein